MLPPQLQGALRQPADYSERFVQTVDALKEALVDRLGMDAHHDKDMNYSVAQQIIFFADDDGSLVKPGSNYRYRIVILITSRAPMYTFVFQRRTQVTDEFKKLGLPGPGEYHLRTAEKELPVRLLGRLSEMSTALEEDGYLHIEGRVLRELAPGRHTEMDGVPATVFQALFSEMF
jgi:hypothetical protein